MTDKDNISKYMEDIKKWCDDPDKLLQYEKSIRETIEQNKFEDYYFRTSDSISENLWCKIIDAVNYDSAAPVRWAVKKLYILYNRIQLGEKIYVPCINTYLEKVNFERTICKEFSISIFNEILELSQSNFR